jgi:integrase
VIAEKKRKRRRSVTDDERRIRKHLGPLLGHFEAAKVREDDLDAYVDRRQQQGAENGGINRELALVSRAFKLARRRGIQGPIVEKLPEAKPRTGIIEPDEIQGIVAELDAALRPAVRFAYATGWRLDDEVVSLEWKSVDLRHRRVTITETKGGDVRRIYLRGPLLSLIQEQWREHAERYAWCRWVFHRNGRQIKSLREAWNAAVKRAGLPEARPHDMRRSAVRNMRRAGVPEQTIMKVVGHRTRAMLDRYGIVADQDVEDAADAVASALSVSTPASSKSDVA